MWVAIAEIVKQLKPFSILLIFVYHAKVDLYQAANARERRRMDRMNEAFIRLVSYQEWYLNCQKNMNCLPQFSFGSKCAMLFLQCDSASRCSRELSSVQGWTFDNDMLLYKTLHLATFRCKKNFNNFHFRLKDMLPGSQNILSKKQTVDQVIYWDSDVIIIVLATIHLPCLWLRDAFPFQNGWIFGKVPKGGEGYFQSKNLCCRFLPL